MIIKNQQGYVEGIFFMVILMLTTLLILHLYLCSLEYKKMSIHLDQTICVKEYLINLKETTIKINRANRVIKSGQLVSFFLFLFPGISTVSLSFENIKKVIKKYQEFVFFDFNRKIIEQINQGCHLSIHHHPYQWQGIQLKRNADELTFLKQKRVLWLIKTPLAIYHVHFSIKNNTDLEPRINIL